MSCGLLRAQRAPAEVLLPGPVSQVCSELGQSRRALLTSHLAEASSSQFGSGVGLVLHSAKRCQPQKWDLELFNNLDLRSRLRLLLSLSLPLGGGRRMEGGDHSSQLESLYIRKLILCEGPGECSLALGRSP